jgi:hypothetical protein
MIRLTGMPRWYIKRQAARLGLTLHMDRTPWTASEMNLLEKLVGHISSASIAKRLHRPESSVVNKLKRIGTSRRVRNGYTMCDLGLCFGEDHHKITQWIKKAGCKTDCRAHGATMEMATTSIASAKEIFSLSFEPILKNSTSAK